MSASPAETRPVTDERVIPRWVQNQGLRRCFVYTGSSMLPLLGEGQLLYVRPQAADVAIGDVIVFDDPARGCVVHRVVSVAPAGFVTRGDNNRLADPLPVLPEQIIGRVELVEANGRIRPVAGGERGLRLARRRRQVSPARRWLNRLLEWLHHWWYYSPRLRRLLRGAFIPGLLVMRLQTPAGPLVKAIFRGRVIARWAPGQETPHISKPYTLFVDEADLRQQDMEGSVKRL
jgi:hypothetical protein